MSSVHKFASDTKNDESDVLSLSRKWIKAELDADVTKVSEILDDRYASIASNGSIMNREEWLRLLPSVKYETLTIDDRDVMIYGSTAIIRGILTVKGQLGDKTIDGRHRSTDVFVYEEGRWRAISSQLTRLPE